MFSGAGAPQCLLLGVWGQPHIVYPGYARLFTGDNVTSSSPLHFMRGRYVVPGGVSYSVKGVRGS